MHRTQKRLDILDETLDKKCQSEQIPGMALSVSEDGERIFDKMYGYRDAERKQPVTADTIFGAASITKSFAALAVMQLVDAGKLAVEDPVIDWLPEFKVPHQTYSGKITIHHLLTHTAGFPGLSTVNQARRKSIEHDPDGAYLFGEMPKGRNAVKSVTDVMEAMAETDFKMLGAPGEVFNYSNESYALLQEIIERASGRSFIVYMENQIFEPLQMKQSTFLTEDLSQRENTTELYAYTKDIERNVFHSPAWWDVGEIYANGSLKTSASDLMTYLEVYRLGGLVNGKRIVSEESVRKMTESHVTLPNGNQYGYGLQVGPHSNIHFIGHGGSIKGVSSNIQLAKEKGLAVCVLMNIADADAEGMAFTVMNQLLDIHDVGLSADFSVTTDALEKYTGHYRTLEGQEVDVGFRNDTLYIQDIDDITLRPYEANKFLTPDGRKLIFTVDDSEQVTGVFRGMRWLPRI